MLSDLVNACYQGLLHLWSVLYYRAVSLKLLKNGMKNAIVSVLCLSIISCSLLNFVVIFG